MNIFRAQVRQAEARIKLIDAQLARSRMLAPFDALIVSGDLSQKIGAAVRRGDVLFELTPLAKYRVILMVDESEYARIKEGQEGRIVFTALPDRSFAFEVTKVTPVARSEGGKNTFRVEGRLKRSTPRLRPGMQGAGKIEIEERPLIWIWTRKLVDWVRLATWRWLP
jgi:multidrug efflux pump subunit AcrA (membrane-fusion protein)